MEDDDGSHEDDGLERDYYVLFPQEMHCYYVQSLEDVVVAVLVSAVVPAHTQKEEEEW